MNKRLLGTALALAWLFTGLIWQPVEAVPAFARKYRTSCATCHSPFPKLNAFGNAFRANGYRFPVGDEEFVKDKPVPMGAEGQKRAFPDVIWPGDIPGGSVASFIIEGAGFSVHPNEENVKAEFNGVEAIGLVIGGTVGESWSFFGDIDLFEDGQPGGIGRLFIQYNHSPRFNIRIGQIEPRAVPFSNHRRLLRMTGYLANTFPVLPADDFFGFSPNQRGMEVYGGAEGPNQRGGFEWAAGVVNGEFGGAMEALEGSEGPVGDLVEEVQAAYEENGGEFDVNNGKDVYARLSYKLGGLGVLGGGNATQAKNWRDDSIRLGAFFYRGTAGAFLAPAGANTFDANGNRFWRYGVDIDACYKDFNLLGGVELFRDNLQDGRKYRVRLYTGELQWVAYPWLVPAARLEMIDPDYAAGTFSRFSTDLSVLALANVKMMIGYTRSFSGAPDLEPFAEAFRTGIDFLF